MGKRVKRRNFDPHHLWKKYRSPVTPAQVIDDLLSEIEKSPDAPRSTLELK